MADLADQSDHKVQDLVERGVRDATSGRNSVFRNMTPNGHCHWCGESVAEGKTHCAPAADSCAEDHEKYLKFRMPGGGNATK